MPLQRTGQKASLVPWLLCVKAAASGPLLSVTVFPQLELLEVRRQQEEEERKRQPPSPEPSTKVSEETESQQQW